MPNPHLESLFSLLAARTISPAERDELMALIADPAHDKDLREYIARVIEQTGDSIPLPDEPSRAILLTILQTRFPQADADAPVVPMYGSRRRRWVGWVAAAVVLLLAGSATWWGLRRSPNVNPGQNTVVAHDLAPGGNKAVLTLADGSHITLDSAQPGVVAMQGNTQVQKQGNGRLAYTGGVGGEAPHNQNARLPKADAHIDIVYNTLTTPRGGQYQLRLSDGTQVWLNAASSITYPTAFTGNERIVTITGEAYFEVSKDPGKGFRVLVGTTAAVQVLGTHFNVNAYSDEPAVTTTVLEGKVRFIPGVNPHPRPDVVMLLTAGEQAGMDRQGHLEGNPDPDLGQTMAWKNGLFQFDHADIQTVMRQLARWYDVDVSYEGPAPDVRFVGKLPRDANASQVLRVLQKERVHFRIEGKKIIVTK